MGVTNKEYEKGKEEEEIDPSAPLPPPQQEEIDPSAPLPRPQQPRGFGPCDVSLFVCYMIVLAFFSAFPFWGQWRAYKIWKKYDEYVKEEDHFTADYQLTFASYGLYGVCIIFKKLGTMWWKYVRKCHTTYSKLHRGEEFNLSERICAYFGMLFLTLGLGVICMLWYDAFHFSHKFTGEYMQAFLVTDDRRTHYDKPLWKYWLGHALGLLSQGPFFILYFAYMYFNSPLLEQRVVARCMHGITAIFYAIYCYYYYAIKWVYYNENTTNENQQPSVRQNGFKQSQPITLATATAATAVPVSKDSSSDNTVVATRVVLMENNANNGDTENNNRNEQTDLLVQNPNQDLELQVSAVEQEQVQELTKSCDNYWLLGSIMLTIGTCGLYIFPYKPLEFCWNNLNREEWDKVVITCGLYLLYILWKSPYDYLYSNRFKCDNIMSKIVLEVALFVWSLTTSYWLELPKNLYCVPFTKRWWFGVAQSFPFAPFLCSASQNTCIRLFAKLIINCYNAVAYYLILEAVNYSFIAIVIMIVINYPVYCGYRFVVTNITVLKIVVNWKRNIRYYWRCAKFAAYNVKFSVRSGYVDTMNRINISIASVKNWYKEGKEHRKNVLFRRMQNKPSRVEGDAGFKQYKRSDPSTYMRVHKEYKDWEYFEDKHKKTIEPKSKIKNTMYLLKCAKYKIIAEYKKKTSQVVIYEERLWEDRYDIVCGEIPRLYADNISRDQVTNYVNYRIQSINNSAFYDDVQHFTVEVETTNYKNLCTGVNDAKNAFNELIKEIVKTNMLTYSSVNSKLNVPNVASSANV